MNRIISATIAAGTAAVMLLASCQRDELQGGSISGEEVSVSISATMPIDGGAVVKSNDEPGNASYVNRCIMGVYLNDDEMSSPERMGDTVVVKVDGTTHKAEFGDLQLVSGHKYLLVFWADNAAGDSDNGFEDNHYNTADFPEVTFKDKEGDTYKSNDDTRDAFFASYPIEVNGPSSHDIELHRPFGQLNITTNDYRTVAEDFASLLPTQVKIDFSGIDIPTGIDLLTGELTKDDKESSLVSGPVGIAEVSYPIAADGCRQLSFDYIFAPYEEEGEEQQLVLNEFKMHFLSRGGQETISAYTFQNIPVRRNYRTNVSGNLLTDRTGIDVEVVPDFNDPDLDKDAELLKLMKVLEKGGNYTLQEDVEIAEALVMNGNVTATIDLNGCNIINTTSVPDSEAPQYGNTTVFELDGNAVLNIEGDGDIHAISTNPEEDGYRMAVYAKGHSTVNIYGGNFLNDQDFNDHNAQLDLIYADQSATINIYGGRFESKCANDRGYWVLNLKDDSDAAINVYGGTFVNFDPSSSMTENPVKNFVADDYSTVKVSDEPDPNGTYVVVKDGEQLNVPVEAGTPETFVQALASAAVSEISVESNLSITGAALALEEGAEVEVNLNDHTLTFSSASASVVAANASLTLSDGTVKAESLPYEPAGQVYDLLILGEGGSITLQNVDLETSNSAIGVNSGITGGASLVVRKSKISGAVYSISTNASKPTQNVRISLEDSEFDSPTPLLINIPCELEMTGCTVNGDFYGLIMRGGNAEVTDSRITLNYTDNDGGTVGSAFDNMDWQSGNIVNVAALTVGNKGAGYQYPTRIALHNTVVEIVGPYVEYLPAMYVWANQGDGLGVTITYDGDTKFYGDRIYGNNGANITVNGAAAVSDEGDTRP